MKLIGTLQGVAAYREIVEEYAPEKLPPLTDIMQAVKNRYQFQQSPTFVRNAPMTPMVWNFQNGRYTQGDENLGILQLVMTPKGDSVASSRTEYAELVLDDLIEMLDTQFGYRLRQSTKGKIYWSHLVVEFDKSTGEYIEKIGAIERFVTEHINNKKIYRFKGCAFGARTSPLPPNADTIDILEDQDFLIEHRVDTPFEQNRFFSSAPLTTDKHIRALEEIESIIRK
jgi:hypothetical protein